MLRKVIKVLTIALLVLALLASVLIAAYFIGKDKGHPIASSNYGPHPQLPEPTTNVIPTVNSSTRAEWPKGAAPLPAKGFAVKRFAQDLQHPRWIYVLPNGDVLVAESTTLPPSGMSIEKLIAKGFMRKDGTLVDNGNRITLLRDSDGDGVTELQTTFLSNLNQPFGMLLLKNKFYVANTDGVLRYDYTDGATTLNGPGQKIVSLPSGGYNNHWTRNLVANAAGTKIYITVGSGSNIAEQGMQQEIRRACILEINPDGSGERIFASGLRNPVGLAFEPETGALWTAVNERDLLGEDLVPDYMTRVRENDFYGWPYAYWGQHVDVRVTPQAPHLVAKAIAPDYSLGAHTASLGLAFSDDTTFPEPYQSGAFIGQHGSWNRAQFSGYKVIYVPFKSGLPNGLPLDFLTGFMPDKTEGIAYGRPVGVAFDKTGALLVADDTGNIIWRVKPVTSNLAK